MKNSRAYLMALIGFMGIFLFVSCRLAAHGLPFVSFPLLMPRVMTLVSVVAYVSTFAENVDCMRVDGRASTWCDSAAHLKCPATQ